MFDRFSDHAKQSVQHAQYAAYEFNHEYIGTEHILLGVIRGGDGVAAGVLKNLDIETTAVRSASRAARTSSVAARRLAS